MFRSILVATDGSAHADAAVDLAGDLAGRYGARLVIVHIMRKVGGVAVTEAFRDYIRIEHADVTDELLFRSAADSLLSAAKDRAAKAGARNIETEVCLGDAATTIIDAASRYNAQLIVLGRRGRGDVAGLLLGSVSHKVAQLADCACLTVK